MEIRKDELSGAAKGAKTKLLFAGLAAAALLAVGAMAGYAFGQTAPMTGESRTGSMMGSGGMGGSMMGAQGSGTGSMMSEGQMMGQFDEEKPFDLQFIDQMIMHHEGAIMSSEHMIGDSKRPELRRLARSIQKSQSGQVEQMQDMRERWYPHAERTFGMMDPSRMEEMMGDGAMRQMMGGSMQDVMGGDATDAMFLRMMIPHHRMAVEMSERALEEAEHPELKKLAQKIKDEQSAEIELMRGQLKEIEATTDN